MRRTGKFHFWDIYPGLPRETRSYLPQFVAINYLLNYADEHQFVQDNPFYPIPTEVVKVSQFVNLQELAKQLNVCYEDLLLMNPELKRGVVPPDAKDYALNIPKQRAPLFYAREQEVLAAVKTQQSAYRQTYRKYWTGQLVANLPSSKRKSPSYYQNRRRRNTAGRERIYHTIKTGESLGGIAERYKVRASDLRAWNGLWGNRIYAGKRLSVWVKPSVKTQVAKSSANTPKATPRTNTRYTVQRGDSLWEIAKKFQHLGTSVERIKALNNLRSNSLDEGQTLIVD